jgi:AraC-like DNA-binding protein
MLDDIYLPPSRICYFRLAAQRFGATHSQRETILEGTGVCATEIDDLQTEISFPQLMRLIGNMNRLYGEGWFLGAPELWTMACFRPLGVAAVTAPNLGAALDVVVQHLPVGVTQQRLNLQQQSGAALLRHIVASAATEGEHRFLAFSVLLGLSTIFEGILGAQKSALSYEFIWSEPPYGADLEKALGGPVRWGAAVNAMIIPRRLLGVSSPLTDPVLHWGAVESLMEARRRSMSEGVKERIERLLSQSEFPRVRFDEAARMLGLSQRTLTRRLFEQGVSYRALVDSELRQRARHWLDSGLLAHAEIAERLGFSEMTSFNRACRRWFPAKVRSVAQINSGRTGNLAPLPTISLRPQTNAA